MSSFIQLTIIITGSGYNDLILIIKTKYIANYFNVNLDLTLIHNKLKGNCTSLTGMEIWWSLGSYGCTKKDTQALNSHIRQFVVGNNLSVKALNTYMASASLVL